ncbi:hypothetical protein JRQ81_009304 [Phrynocephalus forsythii]|uniref:Uncharacterized protein n=1 Tax=Phrynocephalus forsythii TaxID=171643 RepID=A0A9Q0X9K5_9SAUR|nr:hypothetical protein JRQ81_009304 [Phrynocephalus forsythii]
MFFTRCSEVTPCFKATTVAFSLLAGTLRYALHPWPMGQGTWAGWKSRDIVEAGQVGIQSPAFPVVLPSSHAWKYRGGAGALRAGRAPRKARIHLVLLSQPLRYLPLGVSYKGTLTPPRDIKRGQEARRSSSLTDSLEQIHLVPGFRADPWGTLSGPQGTTQ